MSESGGRGLAIAVIGATGALGREFIDSLADHNLPIRELHLYASPVSVGEDIEFRDDLLPVETELGSLRGLDLVLLCTPAEVSLDLVRLALHAEVPCIDCSGALSARAEVPLLVAGLSAMQAGASVPLVATPAGPTLAWSRLLAAVDAAAGLRRVVGTLLQPASSLGRRGIESLSQETIDLLTQRDSGAPPLYGRALAFDCLPGGTTSDERARESGTTPTEDRIVAELRRLVPGDYGLSLSIAQVPTFVGEGASLVIETERPLSPEEARDLLSKTTDVVVWPEDEQGPTTRDTTGSESILVGQIRCDASVENGLQLWVTADALHMAARNLIRLAESRIQLN